MMVVKMQTILIVDDEPEICEELKEFVEGKGFRALTASDGRMALEMFAAQPVDLVVMDVIMPHKEGIETILELRKRAPGVKIIAISGGGRARHGGFLMVAKRAGAHQVFAKPLKLRALYKAILELLPSDSTGKSDPGTGKPQ